jgi:putative PIN family toxin of toxin-antitoxin system
MTPQSAKAATTSASLVVLDTNVVLDLWLFGDMRAQPLQQALHSGRVIALVTAPMLAELADVLSRPFVNAWPVAPSQVLATLQASSRLVDPPVPSPRAPRCTDGDDQQFIDLAWAWPAGTLFSRDRAVLRLARAALRHGLQITTPERWALQQAPV